MHLVFCMPSGVYGRSLVTLSLLAFPLKRENESLRKQLKNEQDRLNEALQTLVHPQQITARVSELKRKVQTGVGDIR